MKRLKSGQVGLRQPGHDFGGHRALDGDHPQRIRHVVHVNLELRSGRPLLLHPGDIFGMVGGVDDDQIPGLIRQPVDDDVVDDSPLLVRQERVLRVSWLER